MKNLFGMDKCKAYCLNAFLRFIIAVMFTFMNVEVRGADVHDDLETNTIRFQSHTDENPAHVSVVFDSEIGTYNGILDVDENYKFLKGSEDFSSPSFDILSGLIEDGDPSLNYENIYLIDKNTPKIELTEDLQLGEDEGIAMVGASTDEDNQVIALISEDYNVNTTKFLSLANKLNNNGSILEYDGSEQITLGSPTSTTVVAFNENNDDSNVNIIYSKGDVTIDGKVILFYGNNLVNELASDAYPNIDLSLVKVDSGKSITIGGDDTQHIAFENNNIILKETIGKNANLREIDTPASAVLHSVGGDITIKSSKSIWIGGNSTLGSFIFRQLYGGVESPGAKIANSVVIETNRLFIGGTGEGTKAVRTENWDLNNYEKRNMNFAVTPFYAKESLILNVDKLEAKNIKIDGFEKGYNSKGSVNAYRETGALFASSRDITIQSNDFLNIGFLNIGNNFDASSVIDSKASLVIDNYKNVHIGSDKADDFFVKDYVFSGKTKIKIDSNDSDPGNFILNNIGISSISYTVISKSVDKNNTYITLDGGVVDEILNYGAIYSESGSIEIGTEKPFDNIFIRGIVIENGSGAIFHAKKYINLRANHIFLGGHDDGNKLSLGKGKIARARNDININPVGEDGTLEIRNVESNGNSLLYSSAGSINIGNNTAFSSITMDSINVTGSLFAVAKNLSIHSANFNLGNTINVGALMAMSVDVSDVNINIPGTTTLNSGTYSYGIAAFGNSAKDSYNVHSLNINLGDFTVDGSGFNNAMDGIFIFHNMKDVSISMEKGAQLEIKNPLNGREEGAPMNSFIFVMKNNVLRNTAEMATLRFTGENSAISLKYPIELMKRDGNAKSYSKANENDINAAGGLKVAIGSRMIFNLYDGVTHRINEIECSAAPDKPTVFSVNLKEDGSFNGGFEGIGRNGDKDANSASGNLFVFFDWTELKLKSHNKFTIIGNSIDTSKLNVVSYSAHYLIEREETSRGLVFTIRDYKDQDEFTTKTVDTIISVLPISSKEREIAFLQFADDPNFERPMTNTFINNTDFKEINKIATDVKYVVKTTNPDSNMSLTGQTMTNLSRISTTAMTTNFSKINSRLNSRAVAQKKENKNILISAADEDIKLSRKNETIPIKFWFRDSFHFGTMDGNFGKANTYGNVVMTGVDAGFLSNKFILGAAFSFGWTKLVNNDSRENNILSFSPSLYSRTSIYNLANGDEIYANTSLSYMYSMARESIEIDRNILDVNNGNSSFSGNSLGLDVRGGYSFSGLLTGLSIEFGIFYNYLNQNSYDNFVDNHIDSLHRNMLSLVGGIGYVSSDSLLKGLTLGASITAFYVSLDRGDTEYKIYTPNRTGSYTMKASIEDEKFSLEVNFDADYEIYKNIIFGLGYGFRVNRILFDNIISATFRIIF